MIRSTIAIVATLLVGAKGMQDLSLFPPDHPRVCRYCRQRGKGNLKDYMYGENTTPENHVEYLAKARQMKQMQEYSVEHQNRDISPKKIKAAEIVRNQIFAALEQKIKNCPNHVRICEKCKGGLMYDDYRNKFLPCSVCEAAEKKRKREEEYRIREEELARVRAEEARIREEEEARIRAEEEARQRRMEAWLGYALGEAEYKALFTVEWFKNILGRAVSNKKALKKCYTTQLRKYLMPCHIQKFEDFHITQDEALKNLVNAHTELEKKYRFNKKMARWDQIDADADDVAIGRMTAEEFKRRNGCAYWSDWRSSKQNSK